MPNKELRLERWMDMMRSAIPVTSHHRYSIVVIGSEKVHYYDEKTKGLIGIFDQMTVAQWKALTVESTDTHRAADINLAGLALAIYFDSPWAAVFIIKGPRLKRISRKQAVQQFATAVSEM